MGKKGSLFSAIKRVFIPSSKDKLVDESGKRSSKEKKKKGRGKLKHGDSFIPLFREPSSIEKILGEAEQEHHLINFRPLSTSERPRTPSFVPPQAATHLKDANSPSAPTTPKVASPPRGAIPQGAASPPRSATPQREVSPPRSATPPRVTSPPQGSTSERVISSPNGTSPPKSAAPQRTVSPPRSAPVAFSSQAATSSNAVTSPKSPSSGFVSRLRPVPSLKNQHISATRIQTAYRGYMARRSYGAMRGLARLQELMKGQSVKRQTTSAMKCMQLLVQVQNQIQSRRLQMLENKAVQRQAMYKDGKDSESCFGKRSLNQVSENGNADEWDASMLTKEEIEARTQKKFEAVVKREKAMAYAYSYQLQKATPSKGQAALMDIRSTGGFPWLWNWLDRQTNPFTTPIKPSEVQAIKILHLTPPRPTMTSPQILHSSNHSQQNLRFDNSDAATPRSTRSAAIPTRMKLSPTPPSRVPGNKFTRSRATGASNSPFGAHFRDDDSLTSCPPFSVPRYMEPTLSAKAKTKGTFGMSPDDQSKRRVSFPMAQGSKRGSLFSTGTTPNREAGSRKVLERNQSLQSIGNLSVDSAVSMPATVGRKPFNRFV